MLRRIVPGLFLAALLLVFQLAVSIDWPPGGSFALARPRIASGDEPHYLLITNSLLRDGDLQLQNDYWRAALGSGEAGEVWNGTLLDHHTFIVNPETGQSWLWQSEYDWTRPVICYPGTCMGYAPRAGVTPPSIAETIEAPAHPVAFPAAVAAVLTAFRPGPADTEALSLRVAAFFSWLAVVVMYLTARRAGLTVPWSLAAVALVGVASSFFPYARSFFAETSIALAVVAGLYALQADRPAIAGVCIACAMFLKPPFAVIALGWIAERIWARRPRSAAVLAAVVGVAALGLAGFDWWLARKPVIGGAGVVQLVAGLGNLWWMFLHPHAGLLVFVPWAVIPMLAPFFLRPRLEPPADREAMLLRQVALGAAPYLCVLLVLADFTGYCYGPRYFVALLPMLGLAAIVLAHRHPRLRVPLVGLGLLAALVAVPAAARYPYLFSTTPLQILAPPIPPWAR